jgi:hypothetical protein
LDALHFFRIREFRAKRNGLDGFQRAHRAAINRIDKGANCAPLFGARGIVLIFVMALASVEGGLDDFEQDIRQGILQAVKLMGDKTDEVQMTIVVGATGYLKNLGFHDQVSIVANPVMGQIESGNDRRKIIVEQP